MTEPSRAELMGRRVLRHAERAGLTSAEVATIGAAHDLAVSVRTAMLPGDQHPDFLHPGRTSLILLTDAGVRDGNTVAAGCVCETVRADLRVPAARIAATLGADIAALVGAVPEPIDTQELIEQLITASEQIQVLAVAEHLDHARHLHLRPRVEWASRHALTCEVYMPVAQRVNPALFRRLRWWCRMFEERYLADR